MMWLIHNWGLTIYKHGKAKIDLCVKENKLSNSGDHKVIDKIQWAMPKYGGPNTQSQTSFI